MNSQDTQTPSVSVAHIEKLLEYAPIAMGASDPKSERILFLNKAFRTLFGYTLDDFQTIDDWYKKASPIPDFRTTILEPWIQSQSHNQQPFQAPTSLETEFRCKNGKIRHVRLFFMLTEGKRFFYFSDITDHWIAEKRLQARSKMLEMVAKSSALKDVLTVIVQQIQQESPGAICSVLLFNPKDQTLLIGAAPDLPESYNQAIHGVKVGPMVGSCGAAAYLNQRIIVEDIDSHPNWQPYLDIARPAKLKSCWSEPICSADGTLLGTFAIYNGPTPAPTDRDIEQIQFASNLASIAIENHYAHQELERRAYYDYLTGLANRRSFFEQSEIILNKAAKYKTNCALIMLDVDHFKCINDVYGHDQGDLVLQYLAKESQEVLPEDTIFSRIGGEEFAILLSEMSESAVRDLTETLRHTLSSKRLTTLDGDSIQMTVSIGIAFSQGEHCYTDELLREADKALYIAKETGRNKVCVFGEH